MKSGNLAHNFFFRAYYHSTFFLTFISLWYSKQHLFCLKYLSPDKNNLSFISLFIREYKYLTSVYKQVQPAITLYLAFNQHSGIFTTQSQTYYSNLHSVIFPSLIYKNSMYKDSFYVWIQQTCMLKLKKECQNILKKAIWNV